MPTATCARCGVRATWAPTAKSYQYETEPGGELRCPVIQERAAEGGGSTSDTDCDNLLDALEREHARFRGQRLE